MKKTMLILALIASGNLVAMEEDFAEGLNDGSGKQDRIEKKSDLERLKCLEAYLLNYTKRSVVFENLIKNYLDFGGEITLTDDQGNNLLHLACTYPQIAGKGTVEFLLSKGDFNLNTTNKEGYTPFELACKNSRYEIAALLVDAGAINMLEASAVNSILESLSKKLEVAQGIKEVAAFSPSPAGVKNQIATLMHKIIERQLKKGIKPQFTGF